MPKRLTLREVQLIRYILETQPISVGDVAAHFAKERGVARTTILTVMERLRDAGWLGRKRVDGVFKYSAKLDQDEFSEHVVGTFVNEMLGGSVAPFAAWLGGDHDLAPEDLNQLRSTLERMKSKTRDKGGRQ